MQYINF